MGCGKKAVMCALPVAAMLITLSTSVPTVQNNSPETLESIKHDDDDIEMDIELQFDDENSDISYNLNFDIGSAEIGDAYEGSNDVVKIHDAQLALTCWYKTDSKTRVLVSVDIPDNTEINCNIEPDTSDNNLTSAGDTRIDIEIEDQIPLLKSLKDNMTRYRLPNNTVPRVYHIEIEPNMEDENFTWTGMVSVDIEVVASTSILTLHAYRNLVIYENCTSLVDSNITISTPVRHTRDEQVEFLKLLFDYEIPVGEYTLNLKFRGAETMDTNEESKVSSDLSMEEYVESQGERILDGFYKISRTIAGTHFEATKARRAFPCWDEPGLKARFHVTIVHSSNYTAISNMPEKMSYKASDNMIRTNFGVTPEMSTYLLTFVISDYQTAINEHQNVSLHSSKLALKKAMHLLDLSPRVVKFMESYTGNLFGLPRVGSVLLPVYTSGATEHWGLVSYRESLITFNPIVNTTKELDVAGTLIAHELSHSWFGNRVTPLWWNDLWLNEAFANYFQYYIMDEINENWRGVELFVVSIIQEVVFLNDNGEYGPVRWMPITNAEIAQMFNQMVYAKGAAILHMFRNVLGDDAFRDGIRKYLAAHSFGTAVADDLIAAFQEVYDQNPNQRKPLNLREVMMPWLEQKGYPMVSVNRNYTTGDTEVSQKSTIIDSPNKWWIPLTFATKSSPRFASTLPARWISDKEDSVTVDHIDKDDWMILNIQASGYYRVNYDDENWTRLADYLNTDDYRNIHVLNRAQLISDAFYHAKREPSRYFDIFYRLTEYLSREVEYLPWRSAYSAIIQIEEWLHGTGGHKMFLRRICKLMHNYVEKVGFEVRETDDHLTKLSRTDVIHLACRFGHTGCFSHASMKLMKLAADPVKNRLHPDTIDFIYCAGLRGLNDGDLKRRSAMLPDEHTRIINNVHCTEDHEIHRDIFNTMLTENITNLEEPRRLLVSLLKSTEGNFNFAVKFFLEKHRAFNKSVPCMVMDIFEVVGTRARLEKFQQVLQSNALSDDSKTRTMEMFADAKSNIIKAEDEYGSFLALLINQLSADNSKK